MGQKQTRTPVESPSKKNAFKLFEYQCSTCRATRPIQYFYRNQQFLQQSPRVVCGACNTSLVVEPYKIVDFACPCCKKWQKARLPGRPIPLNMYNMSVVTCSCGFKGEAPVGKIMDIACSECWTHKRELQDVWAEDGDAVRSYCETCKDYKHSFALVPRKKGAEQETDMEYSCENCFQVRPIGAAELLRTEGLGCCDLCGWVGYPEVFPRGSIAKVKSEKSSSSVKKKASAKRLTADREDDTKDKEKARKTPSEKSRRAPKVTPDFDPVTVLPGGEQQPLGVVPSA